MKPPNAREMELAASVHMDPISTCHVAQLLADYRAELERVPFSRACERGWHAFTLQGPCIICGKEQTL